MGVFFMCNEKDQFMRSVQMRLASMFEPDETNDILGIISYELQNYDMTKMSTEIIVYDDDNDKILKSFLSCLIVEGKSKGTIRQYRYSIKRMFDFLGNKKYNEITSLDIRAWLASFKLSGCKSVTLNNQKNNVSSFFTWLFNEQIISMNPCAPIRQIKVPDEEKKAFTSEDIDTIRSNCIDSCERALVELLLSSGVRIEEASNLKLSDIDFLNLTVSVKGGKGDKDRTTFITPVTRKYIKKYLDDNKHKSEYVFTNKYNNKYTTGGLRRMTIKLTKRCGFSVYPHRFRRTLATDLAKKGMPIQEIQKLLGHSNISVTRKYIEVVTAQVEASYRQFVA